VSVYKVYEVKGIKIEKRYLVPEEASRYVGISIDRLKRLRSLNIGPPFIPLSDKKILYDVTDLDKWLETKKVFTGAFDAFVECFGQRS
jgi:hypothetical protein